MLSDVVFNYERVFISNADPTPAPPLQGRGVPADKKSLNPRILRIYYSSFAFAPLELCSLRSAKNFLELKELKELRELKDDRLFP